MALKLNLPTQTQAPMDAMLKSVFAEIPTSSTQLEQPEAKPQHKPKLSMTTKMLVQPKAVTKAVATTLEPEEQLVEEFIQIWTRLEAFGAMQMQKRLEEIKKQLQSIANEKGSDDEEFTFKAPSGSMVFAKRTINKVVKSAAELVEHLNEKFDLEQAFSVVKIGMTELKKLLSENEIEQYVDSVPGSRSLKSVNAE